VRAHAAEDQRGDQRRGAAEDGGLVASEQRRGQSRQTEKQQQIAVGIAGENEQRGDHEPGDTCGNLPHRPPRQPHERQQQEQQ